MYVAIIFKDFSSVIFGFARASATRRVIILNSQPPHPPSQECVAG